MKLSDVLAKKMCPLCEFTGADTIKGEFGSETAIVDCIRCGRFVITSQAVEVLPQDKKYLLSSVCRRWPEKDLPKILSNNVEALASRAMSLSVRSKWMSF
jgi:hypothetical protein